MSSRKPTIAEKKDRHKQNVRCLHDTLREGDFFRAVTDEHACFLFWACTSRAVKDVVRKRGCYWEEIISLRQHIADAHFQFYRQGDYFSAVYSALAVAEMSRTLRQERNQDCAAEWEVAFLCSALTMLRQSYNEKRCNLVLRKLITAVVELRGSIHDSLFARVLCECGTLCNNAGLLNEAEVFWKKSLDLFSPLTETTGIKEIWWKPEIHKSLLLRRLAGTVGVNDLEAGLKQVDEVVTLLRKQGEHGAAVDAQFEAVKLLYFDERYDEKKRRTFAYVEENFELCKDSGNVSSKVYWRNAYSDLLFRQDANRYRDEIISLAEESRSLMVPHRMTALREFGQPPDVQDTPLSPDYTLRRIGVSERGSRLAVRTIPDSELLGKILKKVD